MVQFEFAKNENGEVVNINQAIRGQDYTCANEDCGGQMIPKRGEKRAYYFSHKNIVFSHAGETELHFNTKHLLHLYLKRHIETNMPVFFEYVSACSDRWCGTRAILPNATDIKVEKALSGAYRPDISVYAKDTPILILEIVSSHDLEEKALNYLKESKIPCIQIFASPELYLVLLDNYNNGEPLSFWSNQKQYNFINFSWTQEYEDEAKKLEVSFQLLKDEINNIKEQCFRKRALSENDFILLKEEKEKALIEDKAAFYGWRLEQINRYEELKRETEALTQERLVAIDGWIVALNNWKKNIENGRGFRHDRETSVLGHLSSSDGSETQRG